MVSLLAVFWVGSQQQWGCRRICCRCALPAWLLQIPRGLSMNVQVGAAAHPGARGQLLASVSWTWPGQEGCAATASSLVPAHLSLGHLLLCPALRCDSSSDLPQSSRTPVPGRATSSFTTTTLVSWAGQSGASSLAEQPMACLSLLPQKAQGDPPGLFGHCTDIQFPSRLFLPCLWPGTSDQHIGSGTFLFPELSGTRHHVPLRGGILPPGHGWGSASASPSTQLEF